MNIKNNRAEKEIYPGAFGMKILVLIGTSNNAIPVYKSKTPYTTMRR